MFIKAHIDLKNFTKVFYRITGKKYTRVGLIVFIGFILLGLNSRYSVLLGLTDNLFHVVQKNSSLVQDSIAERANEVSSGANDK